MIIVHLDIIQLRVIHRCRDALIVFTKWDGEQGVGGKFETKTKLKKEEKLLQIR